MASSSSSSSSMTALEASLETTVDMDVPIYSIPIVIDTSPSGADKYKDTIKTLESLNPVGLVNIVNNSPVVILPTFNQAISREIKKEPPKLKFKTIDECFTLFKGVDPKKFSPKSFSPSSLVSFVKENPKATWYTDIEGAFSYSRTYIENEFKRTFIEQNYVKENDENFRKSSVVIGYKTNNSSEVTQMFLDFGDIETMKGIIKLSEWIGDLLSTDFPDEISKQFELYGVELCKDQTRNDLLLPVDYDPNDSDDEDPTIIDLFGDNFHIMDLFKILFYVCYGPGISGHEQYGCFRLLVNFLTKYKNSKFDRIKEKLAMHPSVLDSCDKKFLETLKPVNGYSKEGRNTKRLRRLSFGNWDAVIMEFICKFFEIDSFVGPTILAPLHYTHYNPIKKSLYVCGGYIAPDVPLFSSEGNLWRELCVCYLPDTLVPSLMIRIEFPKDLRLDLFKNPTKITEGLNAINNNYFKKIIESVNPLYKCDPAKTRKQFNTYREKTIRFQTESWPIISEYKEKFKKIFSFMDSWPRQFVELRAISGIDPNRSVQWDWGNLVTELKLDMKLVDKLNPNINSPDWNEMIGHVNLFEKLIGDSGGLTFAGSFLQQCVELNRNFLIPVKDLLIILRKLNSSFPKRAEDSEVALSQLSDKDSSNLNVIMVGGGIMKMAQIGIEEYVGNSKFEDFVHFENFVNRYSDNSNYTAFMGNLNKILTDWIIKLGPILIQYMATIKNELEHFITHIKEKSVKKLIPLIEKVFGEYPSLFKSKMDELENLDIFYDIPREFFLLPEYASFLATIVRLYQLAQDAKKMVENFVKESDSQELNNILIRNYNEMIHNYNVMANVFKPLKDTKYTSSFIENFKIKLSEEKQLCLDMINLFNNFITTGVQDAHVIFENENTKVDTNKQRDTMILDKNEEKEKRIADSTGEEEETKLTKKKKEHKPKDTMTLDTDDEEDSSSEEETKLTKKKKKNKPIDTMTLDTDDEEDSSSEEHTEEEEEVKLRKRKREPEQRRKKEEDIILVKQLNPKNVDIKFNLNVSDYPNYPIFPKGFQIFNKQISKLNAERTEYFDSMDELAKFGKQHKDNLEILEYFNSASELAKKKWNETKVVVDMILTNIKEPRSNPNLVVVIQLTKFFQNFIETIKEKIKVWEVKYEKESMNEPKDIKFNLNISDFPNYPIFPEGFEKINNRIRELNTERTGYFQAMRELAKFGEQHEDNLEILQYFNKKSKLAKEEWRDAKITVDTALENRKKKLANFSVEQMIEFFKNTVKSIQKKIEMWKDNYTEEEIDEPKKKKQRIVLCKFCGTKFITTKANKNCKNCKNC